MPRPEVLFWRTASDLEVDFVIEHRKGLLPVEVKASARPGASAVCALPAFCDDYPDLFLGGLLLHDGTETQWVADRILAAPWHRVT